MPSTATSAAGATRSGDSSRTPSASPDNAAYSRAAARAVVVPPAGRSASRYALRLASSTTVHTARLGATYRRNGAVGGRPFSHAAQLPSTGGAVRASSVSGRPKKSSSATPSGSVT
ncbi:hypothetical protein RIU97_01160 [Streptomyces sp. 147326]